METQRKPFILILNGELKPDFVLSGRNHDNAGIRRHRRNEQAICIYIKRGLELQANCICDSIVRKLGNVTKLLISMYSPFYSLDWLIKYLKGALAKPHTRKTIQKAQVCIVYIDSAKAHRHYLEPTSGEFKSHRSHR
jgi:hypothetical protein